MPSRRRSLLFLFRAFIPTWRFFDDFAAMPTLYYRIGATRESLASTWEIALPPLGRHLGHLFINAQGNARLAKLSVFERLLNESQEYLRDPQTFSETVTYRLGWQIMVDEARKRFHPRSTFYLQFKVGEVFVSGIHRFSL